MIFKFNMFNQSQTIIVYNSARCGDQPTISIERNIYREMDIVDTMNGILM